MGRDVEEVEGEGKMVRGEYSGGRRREIRKGMRRLEVEGCSKLGERGEEVEEGRDKKWKRVDNRWKR